MKIWADMHIHSCLSPCASDDMTPYNIVNMAKLKGLQLIAVTDHNSAKNLPAVFSAAKSAGVTVVPGIETESQEGVHILAYFKALQNAMDFGGAIYNFLPDIPNNPRFFGQQLIYDDQDSIISTEPKLLIQALALPIEELIALIREYEGVAVPAHISKSGHGILDVLGFINPKLGIRTVEMSGNAPEENYAGMKAIRSSDAHQLCDILEPEFALDIENCTAVDFIQHLTS